MEIAVVILLIAGFIAWRWLVRKAHRGINRAVQRKTYQQEQRLLQEKIVLPVRGTAAPAVIDAVVAELNVFDSASAVKQRAYAERVAPETARVSYGSKVITGWAMAIMALTSRDGEVTVMTEMLDATEVDGVMPGVRELGLVHDRIRSAVRKLQESTAEGVA